MANSEDLRIKRKNSMLYALCSMLMELFFLLFATTVGYAQPSNPPSSPEGERVILAKGGERRLKVAIFPFENLTDNKDALTTVMPVIKSRLKAKGLEVLNENTLNKFLLKERIRATGYISSDIARKLKEEFNVIAILVGSVNSFIPAENPRIGLSSRLVNSSDGTILWADHASATGEDFTKVLGLGRVTTVDRLTYKVIDKLLANFTTTPPHKEIEATYRIAVMPFLNKTKLKDVGMIATYMFVVELFKNKKFIPIEYGEVRHMVIDLRIRSKGELDFKNIGAVSRSSGVDGIIVGTVEEYNEGQHSSPPRAVISARLIDAHNNRILWYDSFQLNGDEGIFILDWGKIRSLDNVAYEVISKLARGMSKAEWH